MLPKWFYINFHKCKNSPLLLCAAVAIPLLRSAMCCSAMSCSALLLLRNIATDCRCSALAADSAPLLLRASPSTAMTECTRKRPRILLTRSRVRGYFTLGLEENQFTKLAHNDFKNLNNFGLYYRSMTVILCANIFRIFPCGSLFISI